MITIQSWPSPQALLERGGTFLEASEVENNLIFGLCSDAARQSLPVPWQFWTAEANENVVGLALKTTGQNVIVTRLPDAAVSPLVTHFVEQSVVIPGVTGPADTAAAFADCWSRVTDQRVRLIMNQRLYACRAVTRVRDVAGRLRLATASDGDWLVDCVREFQMAVQLTDGRDRIPELVSARTKAQRLWVWDHDGPVSCVGYSRETRHGAAINQVYTPPDFRCRGYAGAAVAALTQHLLDAGKDFCCLYTDLSNPTANHIYRDVGYQPVCDAAMWRFGDG